MDRTFPFKAVKLWNGLPEDLKRIRNVFNFKTRINLELLQNKLNFLAGHVNLINYQLSATILLTIFHGIELRNLNYIL